MRPASPRRATSARMSRTSFSGSSRRPTSTSPARRRGIIYIDEIDRLRARRTTLDQARRDGEGVQRRCSDPRGDGGQRASPGRAQAPAPGLYPDQHDQHPLQSAVALSTVWRRSSSTAPAPGHRLHSEPLKKGRTKSSTKLLRELQPEPPQVRLIRSSSRLPIVVTSTTSTRRRPCAPHDPRTPSSTVPEVLRPGRRGARLP